MLLKSLERKLIKNGIEYAVTALGSSYLSVRFVYLNQVFFCSVYNNSGVAEGFYQDLGYDNINQEHDRIWFDNFNRCLNFAEQSSRRPQNV